MSDNKNIVKNEEGNVENYRTVTVVTPPVDIYENDDEILLLADVPGVVQSDINIELDKNTLTLEAHRKVEQLGASEETEFEALDYRRAFTVPSGIDTKKISAKLNSGVLSLHLPKSPEIKPRQIQVSVG